MCAQTSPTEMMLDKPSGLEKWKIRTQRLNRHENSEARPRPFIFVPQRETLQAKERLSSVPTTFFVEAKVP